MPCAARGPSAGAPHASRICATHANAALRQYTSSTHQHLRLAHEPAEYECRTCGRAGISRWLVTWLYAPAIASLRYTPLPISATPPGLSLLLYAISAQPQLPLSPVNRKSHRFGPEPRAGARVRGRASVRKSRSAVSGGLAAARSWEAGCIAQQACGMTAAVYGALPRPVPRKARERRRGQVKLCVSDCGGRGGSARGRQWHVTRVQAQCCAMLCARTTRVSTTV